MNDQKKEIGRRIRIIRQRLKQNQKEFAKRIGVSNTAVSSYEHGDTYPSVPALIRIAMAGDVSLDWLIIGAAAVGEELSQEEARLVATYRQLHQVDQQIVQKVAEYALLGSHVLEPVKRGQDKH